MAEQLAVMSADVVPAVMANWDAVSAEQINALADRLYRDLSLDDALSERQQSRLEADAHLLGSLACCKRLDGIKTEAELSALWRAVKDGEGLDVGGLLMGDESRHYDRTTAFVEGLFLPRLRALIDGAFESLAAAAARAPGSPETRAEAFETAREQLDGMFGEFDFDTIDVEMLLAAKCDLLEQLADAELEPLRIGRARLFVYSVHRHLSRGGWTSPTESPLPAADADRIARRFAADPKVSASIEGYDVGGLIEFGKGRGSTGTVAYRAVAAALRGRSKSN